MRLPVVLNTRPVEQAAELSSLLREAGFQVIEAPAIAIVPAWEAATLQQTRLDLQRAAYDWVVLPSQNAGRGLETELRERGSRVVCGTSTAAALGVQDAEVLERFSAAAALETLRTLVRPGERVLVPRAAEGRDELVDGLRALGLGVFAPVAYRTVAAPEAADCLRATRVDVVTVCSPSAVRSVASAMSPDTRAVCLGQTTADEVRAHGMTVAAVSTRPTMAALVTAVEIAMGAAV